MLNKIHAKPILETIQSEILCPACVTDLSDFRNIVFPFGVMFLLIILLASVESSFNSDGSGAKKLGKINQGKQHIKQIQMVHIDFWLLECLFMHEQRNLMILCKSVNMN